MKRHPFALAFLALASSPALLLACSDAQITTRYAPTFAHTPHTVSMLGVYKDGRMNAEIWEQIGPALSAPLGGKCGPGYDLLVSSNPDLSAAIDDYARANGLGDDLLDQIGPAASGDLVMVVTVAGHVTGKGQDLPDTNAMATSAPTAMSGKYRGAGSMGGSGMGSSRSPGAMRKSRALTDGASFEMSASLFSVKEHKSVGVVSMEYTGQSVDDAVSKLAAKLGEELPGSSCAGWDWGTKVDPQKIRDLGEH